MVERHLSMARHGHGRWKAKKVAALWSRFEACAALYHVFVRVWGCPNAAPHVGMRVASKRRDPAPTIKPSTGGGVAKRECRGR